MQIVPRNRGSKKTWATKNWLFVNENSAFFFVSLASALAKFTAAVLLYVRAAELTSTVNESQSVLHLLVLLRYKCAAVREQEQPEIECMF